MRSVFTSPGGEPSIYLAWRGVQRLSRLAGSPAFVSLGGSPVFISLGGESSVYLA